LYGKDDVPEWLADRLAETILSGPRGTWSIFGFALAVPIFWWCSHDVWTVVAAAIGVLFSAYRPVLLHFTRRDQEGAYEHSSTYWVVLYAVGCWGLSLSLAALAARTLVVGDMISVVLALMAAAGYTVGMIGRMSAIPRLVLPAILLLYVPLILVAACALDIKFLVLAAPLAMYCGSMRELAESIHQRIRAQFVAEHELSRLARTDYLTGLSNRASFDARGALLFQRAQSNQWDYALALVDLDGFKSVNDTHGHATGDELLKQVGSRIKATLGGTHFPARLGGDEFGIVFDPGTKADEAIALAKQIVGNLASPFNIAGAKLQISGSIGIATSEGPGDTFASIVERADSGLYHAKNAGRNQVRALAGPHLSPSIIPAPVQSSAGVTPADAGLGMA
jgi:diguanylate cyclase (GGDEF)-like protein